jgi:thiamine-phosphate pyrophosphorylase
VRDARLYLVAPARLEAGELASLVGELADAGVDVVQLREKELEAGDLIRLGEPVAEACRAAGIPFIVNDRPDVALALGADGAHLGQNDLPVPIARRVLGGGIVGLSTHAPSEVDDALDEDIDYFAAGPVYPTPTKEGRPAAGLELVRYSASKRPAVPWFAIGGINPATLPDVLEAGARRVVVVRAITQAPDPPSAAARLRDLLDQRPPG